MRGARAVLVAGALVAAFGIDPVASALPQDRIPGTGDEKVVVRAVASRAVVRPGADLPVAVVFEMAPGWHINPNRPVVPPELGDPSAFIPTRIRPSPGERSPLAVHASLIGWPEPEIVEVAFTGEPIPFEVYGGKAVAHVPVTVAPDAAPGPATATLLVTYQACSDRVCLLPVEDIPVEVTVEVSRDRTEGGVEGDPEGLFDGFPVEVWERIRGGQAPRDEVSLDLFGLGVEWDPSTGIGLLLLLGFAALGGFLLNFTPCVLPVVPIKLMSLSRAAESGRGRLLALGLTASLGVLAFWLLLGVAVATVSGLTATSQLFQFPGFTVGVGAFIALMAVGMGGLFSIPLPQAVYRVTPSAESLGGSFLVGAMTAVLSTPCTAPFMGAALGWATQQTATVSLGTFASIGLGMGAPYLVLSARPAWIRRIPRAGPASDLLKQVMALLLLAVAAYFVGTGVSGWTAAPGEPPGRSYWWAVMGFVAVAGGWTAVRALAIAGSRGGRLGFVATGAVVVVMSALAAVRFTADGPVSWTYYTPGRLEAARAERKAVVLDFTAEWCLNCKALEETVLSDPEVVASLESEGVVPMKVDLTGDNPEGRRLLAEAGRLTIPLLLILDGEGREVLKSDFYTAEQVVRSVGRAKGGGD